MKNLISKNNGFSLIEVVFAMSFLTLIILGVINLQSSNLAMMNSQNNQMQADFYADQGAQILKAIGYMPELQTCSGEGCLKKFQFTLDRYNLIPKAGLDEIAGQIFGRYVEIDPSGLNNAYKATVVVEWSDSTSGSDEKHSVSSDIIISQ